ncbi:MAG: metallophosphoesterase [Aulosira sp. ZfuVER01]|nr:metallophosphoesterase [Aulosira sp. ZfuVER01]MDZ7999265.1 metallophosphoesterase [Aulosira sp. DedVER01a]MDZ8051954.1 metallophosphoesterase [Aulosira sp. ZfuCHP01]
MQILSISNLPIHQIQYLTASAGGVGVIERYLPILSAEVDFIPNNLDAIIATSDLQGVDPKNQQLLAYLLLEELEILADIGKIPSLKNTGMILAGDLYAEVNRRGGVVGDVREIWLAFNRRFRWVAGVAGNHDSLGNTPLEVHSFQQHRNIYYLDGEIKRNSELSLAGISGIIGKKGKPFRRPEKDFIKIIRSLVKQSPDILILHEGPNDPQGNLVGQESIRRELEKINLTHNLLVICGHSYWKVPMIVLENGIQVLKADGRVIVIQAKK